ncbi:hypothetical protein [Microbispora bryophytorum]|uniref:hypothetical protein n=1 Tax=Microbispora bryophytorum TaxID=1460882 RepID=UPI0033FF5381
MDFDYEAEADVDEPLADPALPRHLATLVSALQGPADLGVHHDRHLAYAMGYSSPREPAEGTGSAEADGGHR